MSRTRRAGRRSLALLGWIIALAALVAPGAALAAPKPGLTPKPVPAEPGLVGYPNAMAATGDSITVAFNSGVPFADAPANSWSTGTNASVNSHYLRILAAHPAINGHHDNDAVTGAVMANLAGQVQNVNAQTVDYVTILLGANDACASTEAQMTAVDTFRQQFQTALTALSAGSPAARIYVLSVPDIYNLWAILHTNSSAVFTWNFFGICQSMLQNATSMAQADIDRRARVRQRVVDYNAVLTQVCKLYIHCRFDNNTVFTTPFVPSDVSTNDYFHPAVAGQTKLAAYSYAAGFDFTDSTPPVTRIAVGIVSTPGTQVALFASDNVAVSGIEYKINSGPYIRYTAPLQVASSSTITYRAVDVNGNVEASHAVTIP